MNDSASPAETTSEGPRPSRRRFQFSLRFLLLAMAVACVYFAGWYWIERGKVREAERALYGELLIENVFAYDRVFSLSEYDSHAILRRYAQAAPQRVWLPEQNTIVFVDFGWEALKDLPDAQEMLGYARRVDDEVQEERTVISQGFTCKRIEEAEDGWLEVEYTLRDDVAKWIDVETGRVWTARIELAELIRFIDSTQHNATWINTPNAKLQWLMERSTATAEVEAEGVEAAPGGDGAR